MYSLYKIAATKAPIKLLSKAEFSECVKVTEFIELKSNTALMIVSSKDESIIDAQEVSGSIGLVCKIIWQYGSY